jgi:hypothetical protein
MPKRILREKYNEGQKKSKERYKAIGLAFHKDYAYKKGARPVIYEKHLRQKIPASGSTMANCEFRSKQRKILHRLDT